MWWNDLSLFQQVMFIIAVSSTVVMLVFLILMLIGIGDADFDGDTDISDVSSDFANDEPLRGIGGLKILSLRSFLVFLSIGGWVSFLLEYKLSIWLSLIIGGGVGLIAAILMMFVYRAMMKLESTGNIDYNNAIGKSGRVYIRIPKSNSGIGKITMTLQERFIEINAVTNEEVDLLTDNEVEIISVVNETTVLVKRK